MTDRKVPFFNYPDVFLDDKDKILEIVADVGSRGAFIMQKDIADFEKNLADYLGIKHVIGVANATDAIYMICRASDLTAGDEVIFCSHTMVATAAGIHYSGATPVPVDAGAGHLIDPESVERAITPQTRAIMPTQLNGRCADMDALRDICDRHGLFLLEDSAQALGAKYKGEVAGSFGRGGVISFYPAKTLGCLGDGGCILTNDEEVFEKCTLYRDHGRKDDLSVECWCLNSRLDNLQAAILDYKLTKYDKAIARRRELAESYQDQLADINQLVLPPGPNDDPDRFDIFQNYEIEALRRDELREHLGQNGIGTILPWGGFGVHQFPKLSFTQSLQFTEELFTRMIMLPMSTSLTDEDVSYVCENIRQFYKS
jgi:dTDP-4-amino-4,6-dideoxygalactose transaminase